MHRGSTLLYLGVIRRSEVLAQEKLCEKMGYLGRCLNSHNSKKDKLLKDFDDRNKLLKRVSKGVEKVDPPLAMDKKVKDFEKIIREKEATLSNVWKSLFD